MVSILFLFLSTIVLVSVLVCQVYGLKMLFNPKMLDALLMVKVEKCIAKVVAYADLNRTYISSTQVPLKRSQTMINPF